jgi:hypothetical protein
VVQLRSLQAIAVRSPARLTAMALLLGGCVNFTLDAEEFRRQMTGIGSVERLDVNRPLRDVAATFRERAPACLSVTTTHYSGPGGRYTMTVMTYTPRVVVTDTRVELHLQARFHGPTFHDQGANGAYMFLVHATPLDAQRTRLEIWRGAFGGDKLLSAVQGWASGSFSGCPDLGR